MISLKNISIYIVLSLICLATKAQDIRGTVKDERGNTIAHAFILLSDTTQSNQYNAEYLDIIETDSLGSFHVKKDIVFNKIIANRIGYKSTEVNVVFPIESLDIIMQSDGSAMLEEVVVKGYKQAVKMNTSGLEYNMKYSPIKQGSTLDALRFIPLINIEKENIRIIGKNMVKYFLNGKELKLEGSALNAYIQSISTTDIEKIEVITSYDPRFNISFNQGGINIITKRDENAGWKGNVEGRIWKTHYLKGSGSMQLSYNKKKIASNIFLSGIHNSTWQEKTTSTQYKALKETTEGKSTYDGKTTNFNIQGLFNYSFNKNSSLNGNASLLYSKGDQTEIGNMLYMHTGHNVSYAEIVHNNRLYSDKIKVTTGITFQKIINKSSQFRTSINFYHGNVESSILGRMDSISNGIKGTPHEHYKEIVPQKSTVWSGDAVYTFPLSKKSFMALELSSYFWQIDNNDRYYQETAFGWNINDLLSHHRKVKEWNVNGIISMQNIWSKKFSNTMGLGVQKRNYHSKELKSFNGYKQNFWQPHPFLTLNVTPNKHLSIKYNVEYKLTNPSFSQMNPFKWYTSATTYRIGNPDLSQIKRFQQSITVQLFQNLMLHVNHNYVKDGIVSYNSIKDNGMIESRPENMASYHDCTAYLSLSNIPYLKGKGNLRLTAGAVREWYHAQIPNINTLYKRVSDSYFVQLNNTVTLFPLWEIQMVNSFDYNSKSQIEFTELPASVNFYTSFQKNIKNWRFVLDLSINSFIYDNDIHLRWKKVYNNTDLYTLTNQKGESISYGIKVGYNFGNKRVKSAKRIRSSSRNLDNRLDE